MIVMINTIKVTILIIAIITTTMAISNKEKSVMFLAKKVIALISIQTISNKRQNIKPSTQ